MKRKFYEQVLSNLKTQTQNFAILMDNKDLDTLTDIQTDLPSKSGLNLIEMGIETGIQS